MNSNSNLITKQSVNAIFQIENDTELKDVIIGLFNMYNPNSHISNPDHTLSNIDDAYSIDINPIEIDIEWIKKNWSDLNEKKYKCIERSTIKELFMEKEEIKSAEAGVELFSRFVPIACLFAGITLFICKKFYPHWPEVPTISVAIVVALIGGYIATRILRNIWPVTLIPRKW